MIVLYKLGQAIATPPAETNTRTGPFRPQNYFDIGHDDDCDQIALWFVKPEAQEIIVKWLTKPEIDNMTDHSSFGTALRGWAFSGRYDACRHVISAADQRGDKGVPKWLTRQLYDKFGEGNVIYYAGRGGMQVVAQKRTPS